MNFLETEDVVKQYANTSPSTRSASKFPKGKSSAY